MGLGRTEERPGRRDGALGRASRCGLIVISRGWRQADGMKQTAGQAAGRCLRRQSGSETARTHTHTYIHTYIHTLTADQTEAQGGRRVGWGMKFRKARAWGESE